MKFDPMAFESIRTNVRIENLTSRTVIQPQEAHLVRLLDQGMVLEVPHHSAAQGHSVQIDLSLLRPAEGALEFKATGKVSEVEPGEQTDSLSVTLIQFPLEDWQAVQRVFSGRQDSIDSFFKSVRGY